MKKKYLSIEHKTLADLGVATYKELWEKAQKEGYEGISVSFISEFKKAEDGGDKPIFHAIFSTAGEDRHGDIVEQSWELKSFKKNPVYLDSHNYDSIVHILGRVSGLKVTGEGKKQKLEGNVEFMLENPKGALAAMMAEKGFLNASSVGFIPLEFDEKTGNIVHSELLEISAVSVPANAEALFEKSIEGGEDKGGEETVDEPTEKKEDETVTPPTEPVQPEPKSVSRKSVYASTLSKMAKEKRENMNILRNAVKGLVEDGKKSNAKKIFQALRNLEEQI